MREKQTQSHCLMLVQLRMQSVSASRDTSLIHGTSHDLIVVLRRGPKGSRPPSLPPSFLLTNGRETTTTTTTKGAITCIICGDGPRATVLACLHGSSSSSSSHCSSSVSSRRFSR